ncbi:MAG: Type 1 glutamine amidotransferase-like domain-containing protein [Candidatus Saccharimonadales bacterium]
MKLLLTSSGLSNESLRDALRQMLGKPTGECNFVFIPTSYSGAAGDMGWLVNDIYEAHRMGWKEFRLLDIAVKASWDKKLWWPVIENADVIMVGGGNAGFLSYWMQKAGLFDAMPKLLETKVYVGVSAGSMVMTAGLNTASMAVEGGKYELNLNDPNAPASQISPKTLGYTDFLFRPHWHKPAPKYENLTEESMRKVYAVIKKPIYLVDDQTGIMIEDGKSPKVVSEGRWLLIDHS